MEKNIVKRDISRRRRKNRVKKKTRGLSSKPRLCVTRSNKHLYVQIIDDEKGQTLCGLGTMSKELKKTPSNKKTKESGKEIGKKIAEMAKQNKIEQVVFDRGRCKYHGLLAHVADGAREGGLKF